MIGNLVGSRGKIHGKAVLRKRCCGVDWASEATGSGRFDAEEQNKSAVELVYARERLGGMRNEDTARLILANGNGGLEPR
jgi:hypothetical protein